MTLTFSVATETDAPEIAALRRAVAERLTRDHGKGHWSSSGTEQSALRAIRTSRILTARQDGRIAAMLALVKKKPWAIDVTYFTPARRPLYLLDMAVLPEFQRQGLGRRLLSEALEAAKSWPADALRLDAYDTPAGAGPFYAKCGWSEKGRVKYRGTPLIYYEYLLQDR
jgi:GNAT superfamily N-acetyltransferase